MDGNPIDAKITEIDWDAAMAERGGYDHFMIKEIHEQPRALRETMRGRLMGDDEPVELPGLNLTDEEIKKIERIVMVACGTAYHASVAGKYVFERCAGYRSSWTWPVSCATATPSSTTECLPSSSPSQARRSTP